MKKYTLAKLCLTLGASIFLIACSSNQGTQTTAPTSTESSSEAASSEASSSEETKASGTVTIKDATGEVEVPVNPQRVISLDNRTFDTLSDWGVKLVAVPKDVMDAQSPYVLDESVQNIGNHREPNLEIIAAADPELVIVGQRFASYYDDIKALVPNAAVINLDINVSETSEHLGEALVNGLKDYTTSLGQIFQKEAEAKKLNEDFDAAIATVKASYKPEKKVLAVIVSGGEIGFSAPKTGRVFGPWYEVFSWTPALEVNNSSTDHQGDEVSIEAIAESNPDYILVLDRDAAISKDSEHKPAKDVVENSEALKNVSAIVNGNVVYAPNNTYVTESIQTYIKLLGDIKTAFEK